MTPGLAKLKDRTIKYDALQQLLDDTTDKQISTTDIDSRSILTESSLSINASISLTALSAFTCSSRVIKKV